MNIQTLSAAQQGQYNPDTRKWEGMNLFRQFVEFCQRRRNYHRKQGKGLTRSFLGVDKQTGNAAAYLSTLKRRSGVVESIQLDKKRGILYHFFTRIFNKIFSRKAVATE